HGPPGVRELVTMALRIAGRVRFPLELIELEPGAELARDGYKIAPVPVSHRTPAFGYVLYEDERPGQFDPVAAERLGVQPGPGFGGLKPGERIREGPPAQGV